MKTLNTTFDPNSKAVYRQCDGAAVRRAVRHRARRALQLGPQVRRLCEHQRRQRAPASQWRRHDLPGRSGRRRSSAGSSASTIELNNNVLLYASAATGNSLPGYNARPLQKTQVFQIDGNDNRAYEIGAKLDLLDRKLRVNLSAFYTDFNNRPTPVAGGSSPRWTAPETPSWATSSSSRCPVALRIDALQRHAATDQHRHRLLRPPLLYEPAGEDPRLRGRIYAEPGGRPADQRLARLVQVHGPVDRCPDRAQAAAQPVMDGQLVGPVHDPDAELWAARSRRVSTGSSSRPSS